MGADRTSAGFAATAGGMDDKLRDETHRMPDSRTKHFDDFFKTVKIIPTPLPEIQTSRLFHITKCKLL
jgi:hypothetical protein